jgi:argininosuccinate lyase
VALAETEGKPMDQLSKKQLQEVDNRLRDDVLDCFNYERSVEYRTAKGGTSKASVIEQIKVINTLLK